MSAIQFKRHKKARQTLASLFEKAGAVSVIHYSCESFYDRTDGSSPRITSIAMRKLDTGQTISISIHQQAELSSIPSRDIAVRYNELERKMLDTFAERLGRDTDRIWVHWNMRDENYGFQAIEHRHRVLGGKPHIVPDKDKVDLSRLLIDMYGVGYIGHPRLETLLKRNNISALGFLNGKEEAKAFEQKRYADLHRSTLRKVDVIAIIAQLAYDGDLKTNASWIEEHGISLESITNIMQNNPVYGLLSILALVMTLGTAAWAVF